ncbi:ribonuclease H-like domain-containing protein [Spinellus fusiger]|nr:ribonuclease H-like domain-containing protein [Spinellus fusiger]
MEIPRQQFIQKLPLIKAAIDECDFIAIDAEFSGLHRPGTSNRVDTLENRYLEYVAATQRFIITQFGLSTFKWDEPSGRYIAKPFNFYVFPTVMSGKTPANKTFVTQVQAFDFLAKQQFDFNKWVYQGVPYMTLEEEKTYVKNATERLNNELPTIHIDEKEQGFIKAARETIGAWLALGESKGEGVNINTYNAYQRRLIYQEIRNNYNELVAEGRGGFIRVVHLSPSKMEKRAKERQKQFEKDCEEATGLSKVVGWISESKKILVGHNVLLDLCHIINQFITPLPDNFYDFKTLVHELFPNIVDTKHLCTASDELRALVSDDSSLESLRFETAKSAFKNPRIDTDWEFSRYLHDKAHEAGYDAFITGSVFLRLTSYLDTLKNPVEEQHEEEIEEKKEEQIEVSETTSASKSGWDESDDEQDNKEEDVSEIYNYNSRRVPLDVGEPGFVLEEFINKITMIRTGYKYLNLVEAETIICQSNTFYFHSKTGEIEPQVVSDLFLPCGKNIVEKIDSESGFVVYEKLTENAATVKARLIQLSKTAQNAPLGLTIETVREYLDKLKDNHHSK